MSYAGVESDAEHAMHTYGLSDRKPKHCGDHHGHDKHNWGTKFVCTGQVFPPVSQGKHRKKGNW